MKSQPPLFAYKKLLQLGKSLIIKFDKLYINYTFNGETVSITLADIILSANYYYTDNNKGIQ